ncbi:MAG: C25 family peptidase propeptide domain-containing protein, partial [Gemmatimonadota bacterium]|nr:C25 family peptidase propeptide domain-containing protein [Gemmatimonadota bacterium]
MVPDKTSLRPVPSVFRAVLWTLPVWAGLFSGIYTTAAWAQNAGFRLLSCNERRIEVGFELPGWRAEAIEVRDSRAFSVIRAGEGGELLVAGFPVLPEYKAVIAVPPGSRATVNWQTGGSRELTLPPILPAQPAGEYGEEGGIGSSQKVATSYSADFDTSGAYPAEPVVVRGPKRFRDVMVIEILLRPFVCLQGNAGRLRVLSRVTVSLDLAGSSGFSSAGAAAHPSAAANTGGAFENIYNQVLLNYESSRRWRVESQLVAGPARLSASPFLQGDRWVSIRIAKSDMYALTPELLSVAGVGMEGVDPATFRIYTGDGRMLDEDPKAATLYFSEVSTEVTGSADGTFDPGDRLIFFGRGLDRFLLDEEGEVSSIRHRYDSLAVYWLT